MNQNRATIFKAIFKTLEIVRLLVLNTFKSSFAKSWNKLVELVIFHL